MSTFRFLHAADIHLDSPLKGLAGQEGIAAERIRTATRTAFGQLVDAALEEQVDFLVIAGDLYDGDWRDYRTGLFFAGQMGRLNEAGIPVYLLYGNHDAESQITRRLSLPENVHVFDAAKPASFSPGDFPEVILHGQSFRQRDVPDNLALAYPEPVPGAFNIGVLHTGLGGMGGHENYAPCSLNDLINKGYDYWALGHVHQAQVLNERPRIVFPGNLQGRHARETGAKGACLVSVEDNGIAALETIHCDVVRWAVLPVALEEADSLSDVIDSLRGALTEAVAAGEGRLLACRLVLQGVTSLHEQVIAEEDHLLAEARAAALGLGEDAAWVEKLVIATASPADPRTRTLHEDAVGDLQHMLREASADAELVRQVKEEVGELVRRLPHEIRAEADDALLRAAVAGEYEALIDEARPYLSARLASGED